MPIKFEEERVSRGEKPVALFLPLTPCLVAYEDVNLGAATTTVTIRPNVANTQEMTEQKAWDSPGCKLILELPNLDTFYFCLVVCYMQLKTALTDSMCVC